MGLFQRDPRIGQMAGAKIVLTGMPKMSEMGRKIGWDSAEEEWFGGIEGYPCCIGCIWFSVGGF